MALLVAPPLLSIDRSSTPDPVIGVSFDHHAPGDLGVRSIVCITIDKADVPVDSAAVRARGKQQEGLIRSSASQRDIPFVVEDDAAREVVEAGRQLDNLPAGAGRNGAIDLRGRRPW